MEDKDKKDVKNLFKIFVLLILFTIVCMQAFSVAKYIKTDVIENINLSVTPPPKNLLTGAEFNKKIKESSSQEDANNAITKIVFDYWDDGYMEDTTKIYSESDWSNGTAIDSDLKGAIKMFKSDDGKTVYILSASKMYANLDSADMFYNLNSIVEFEFNNLNVYNVENMDRMFGLCTSLEVLDLSSFNTVNTISMKQLFTQNEKLTTIYVGQMWDTEKVDHTDIVETDEPFLGCTSLIGANGTAYEENNIDISYAHVDEGEENPGYFTYKEEGATFTLFNDRNQNEENKIEQTEGETKIENTTDEIRNETLEENKVAENQTEENNTIKNEVEKENVTNTVNNETSNKNMVAENKILNEINNV